MNILTLEQVSIGYAGHSVGSGINFNQQEQSVVCLLGANGCGKTTLLKTLLGILPSLGGIITLGSKKLTDWTSAELAQFVAYVPQAHHGMFSFRVEDVVLMGCTAHMHWLSVPGKPDKDIAADALDTLGILHLKNRCYIELSGGERQLVLIARALAQRPSLLIMDEPAASLDFGNQIRILEQIAQLKNRGISVFMTTHHPQHARTVADKVAIMRQGKLLESGDCSQVLQPEKLALIYDIPVAKIEQYLLPIKLAV